MEIKKLADIIEWANSWIEGIKPVLIKLGEFETDKDVKQLEAVKRVVSEAIERHEVYTSALNNDIADKAAKIELLEKEIEGRKEGYTALKVRMDTKYISIDEHNDICKTYEKKIAELKKESEKWQDLAKMNRDTICDQYSVCEDFKKKITELEEKVEIYEKEIERLNRYNKNLETANHNLVTRVALLEPEIENLKKSFNALKEEMATRYITIETHDDICNTYEKKIAELEKELADCKVKIRHQKENLDGINKTLEIRTKENESLIAVKKNQEREIEAHEDENKRLSEKIIELKKENTYLKKELEQTCTTKELDLKGHNRREMALVNELADKNDEIKKLNESIEEWKNQERIRTNQLRATERKVEELWKEIEKFTKGEDDDHGKSGFKRYIEHLIEEEERAVPERFKERLNEEITEIFTKEEETKKELNKKFGYAREIAVRLRSEVDKKRIVDISEGAEKILGVSRELFDDAVKALVDDGYQEIIGRIPQATNSYVCMDMHVLATPDVETRETANAENIKSLDFDIPCGEDAIE